MSVRATAFALAGLFVCCMQAKASPYEVKIHDEWIAPFQETTFEVETHLYRPPESDSLRGNVLQTRLELAYGLTRNSEIAVNAYLSYYNGNSNFNGGKISHLYTPMHDETGALHWGVKNEINQVRASDGAEQVFYELTPIAALQLGRWRTTLNLSFDAYFSGARETVFAPSARLAYTFTESTQAGVEYYSEMGPLDKPWPDSQRTDIAYLVLDNRQGAHALHFGVGKGVSAMGDVWVLKFIGTFAFD